MKFIFDLAFSNLRLFSNSLWVKGFIFWALLNWFSIFGFMLLIISLFKLLLTLLLFILFILLFILLFIFIFISGSWFIISFWTIFSLFIIGFIIGFIIFGGLWLGLKNLSIFFFLFWNSFKLLSSSFSSSNLFPKTSTFFSSIWGGICGFILFCFINNNGFGTISILWFNGSFSFFSE